MSAKKTRSPSVADPLEPPADVADNLGLPPEPAVLPEELPQAVGLRFNCQLKTGATPFQFAGIFEGPACDNFAEEFSRGFHARIETLTRERINAFMIGPTFTRLRTHRERLDVLTGKAADATAKRDAANLTYARAVEGKGPAVIQSGDPAAQADDVLAAQSATSTAKVELDQVNASLRDSRDLVSDLERAAASEWRSVLSAARSQLFQDAETEKARRLVDLAGSVAAHLVAVEVCYAVSRMDDNAFFARFGSLPGHVKEQPAEQQTDASAAPTEAEVKARQAMGFDGVGQTTYKTPEPRAASGYAAFPRAD
jgi:hypothetical protein